MVCIGTHIFGVITQTLVSIGQLQILRDATPKPFVILDGESMPLGLIRTWTSGSYGVLFYGTWKGHFDVRRDSFFFFFKSAFISRNSYLN
jgi:hypothetical protein